MALDRESRGGFFRQGIAQPIVELLRQLADLRDFSEGKAPATSGSYQIDKGYNRVPVNQQISSLEKKKKQLQDKIDALFDEARKKGAQPGDLR